MGISNLQNSAPLRGEVFPKCCRSFLDFSARRDALAAVFRIRGIFYDGGNPSTTAISSGVSP